MSYSLRAAIRDRGLSLAPPETHPDANESLEARAAVDQQVLVPFDAGGLLEKNDDGRATCARKRKSAIRTSVMSVRRRRTEREVSKLLAALDLLALLDRRVDAPDHHRADAHAHDAAELRAVDRDDLPHVLAVDVERSPDSLGLGRRTQLQ